MARRITTRPRSFGWLLALALALAPPAGAQDDRQDKHWPVPDGQQHGTTHGATEGSFVEVPICWERISDRKRAFEAGNPAECHDEPPLNGEPGERPAEYGIPCATNRWIARRQPELHECPQAKGWRASPLFDKIGDDGGALLQEMRSYCVYDQEDPEAPNPPGFGPDDGSIVAIERECYAIGAAANGDAIRARSESRFDRQAGRPQSIPKTEGPRPLLVFVDTKGDPMAGEFACGAPQVDEPLCSNHGRDLQAMAERLLCPANPNELCLAEFRFLRGLEMNLAIEGYDDLLFSGSVELVDEDWYLEDISANPVPVNGFDTLYRLKEGVERFFITDINNPAGSAQAQSNIVTMYDAVSEDIQNFNHIPGGSNVLYMDGHVEFIKWTPSSGSKFPLKIRPQGVAADGNNWLNDLALGTSDGG